MRPIKMIVWHCSATKPSMDIGASEIKRWHVNGNGWRDIGYNLIIRRDGTIENGRPLEQAGAHASGYNANSIGICLVGGVDDKGKAENNFTREQLNTVIVLAKKMKADYNNPKQLGHRDLPKVKKDCPSMDIKSFLKENGVE